MEWLQLVLFGNPLDRWLLALLIAAGSLALVGVVHLLVAWRLRPIAQQTPHFIDDVVVAVGDKTNLFVLAVPALYLGAQWLSLTPEVGRWLRAAAALAFFLQLGLWGNAAIGRWVQRFRERNLETNAAAVGTSGVLSFIARLALYSVLLLLALDNIPGVEITALVASLGIGGIAVALAAQNILGDVFASLSITFDKPFVLGDFIKVGDMLGSVEEIGLKTTRLRSLSGEQLIFSNADLLASRIHNYKRMEQRRVAFSFGLAFDTSPAQLRAVPELVRAAVARHEQTRFDRAHFARIDQTALVFEVVYFVETPDFNRYMDIQQAINLELIEGFAAEGVRFAFPAELDALGNAQPRPRERRAAGAQADGNQP